MKKFKIDIKNLKDLTEIINYFETKLKNNLDKLKTYLYDEFFKKDKIFHNKQHKSKSQTLIDLSPNEILNNSLLSQNNFQINLEEIKNSTDETGKNDFHKMAKFFYNKRKDLNTGVIRYLTEEEIKNPIRPPSYFDHFELIKSMERDSAKVNELLQENVFNYVSDLKSLNEILDSFSVTDKFSNKFYNLEDLSHSFYMDHMAYCNAFAITTHHFLVKDKIKKFEYKKVEGKNMFNFSEFKKIRQEDKQNLSKLIFEKDSDIADGYNLNLYRNYIKPYIKFVEEQPNKEKNLNYNHSLNKNEALKQKLIKALNFVTTVENKNKKISFDRPFTNKSLNYKRKNNDCFENENNDIDDNYENEIYEKHYHGLCYTKTTKEKKEDLYLKLLDYYDIEEFQEYNLNEDFYMSN